MIQTNYILLPLYRTSINLNKMKTAQWSSSQPHIDSHALIHSIISKMMYTCKDPYCRHRVSNCTCNFSHYNCAGDPRLSRLDNDYVYSFGNKNHQTNNGKIDHFDLRNTKIIDEKTQRKFRNEQNPQEDYDIRKTRINNLNQSKTCSHGNLIAAGRYQRQQQRGRWVNNSLHQGSRMKILLYESQNPFGRVKRGPFAKNYDTQYEIYQDRVRRTKAYSPQGKSKIASLIRRDRDRSSSK